jgi:hypothetical protein
LVDDWDHAAAFNGRRQVCAFANADERPFADVADDELRIFQRAIGPMTIDPNRLRAKQRQRSTNVATRIVRAVRRDLNVAAP